MPGKDRTRIPRSSPPKSSLKTKTAPYSPTLHLNAPITLRGTGKSPSSLNPQFVGTSGTDPLPLSLPDLPSRPLDANLPNNTTSQVQRITGSRLPAPLKFQGRIGFGLGYSPLSTSELRTTPSQTSLARTGRPSFHVPVIHSPASKFASTANGDSGRPVGPTVTFPVAGARESPQDVVSATRPGLTHTPTAASNVSSGSHYTRQSADSDGMDETKSGDEEPTADIKSNGVDCENDDAVLSPGFDVIQALVDANKFQNMDHRDPYEQSPTTPRPRPFSRDISDIQEPIHTPSSLIASVVTHPTTSSPLTRVRKAHRRSLVAEATDMMLRNPPTEFPLHEAPTSPTSKSKTPSPHRPSHTFENISEIIQQIEMIIGHSCIDREAVRTAHREAGAQSETRPSGAVFGASLNMTIRYASCSSVLEGQTHTLPLVVFACIEELYRAGLRSSRLLRPPPHAPTAPSHTVTQSPAHAHGATHSFPALVAAFNAPPTYGDDVDLALASLDDVGALLLTYLDCLPGGIVPVWVRSVLGDVVGIYEEANGGSDSGTEQKRAITAAQLILRLLPAAQFSLVVYLLAFLSQIPLYEAWNGWNIRGVARAFARVVVGVGAEAETRDVKGKGKDDSQTNGKNNKMYREDDVDWVSEEEDAVEVLEWLLASWDDISDGLFLGPQREGRGRSGSDVERKQDGKGEREIHRAAAMRQLDPSHNTRSDDGTTIVSLNPAAINPSVNALLSRIASLERENAEWQWLQGKHKAELQFMFQAGEKRIAEAEEALMEERNARARAEDALIKEQVVLRSAQTTIEDAVRAERALWVGEVQALREAWERLGIAWEAVGKEKNEVGNIVRGIVERFVAGASKGSGSAKR